LDRGWIGIQNKRIKQLYGEEFHSVVYLVDPANWKPDPIGGWNLSRFYSGMSVQIVKGYFNVKPTYQVTSMELAHCWNEQIYRELGIRLKDFLGVENYDYGVIHGEHSDYTVFEYRPVLEKIADLMLRTFKKREARFEKNVKTKISILTRLVDLYRQVMILIRKKESPVYDSEVEVDTK